MSVNVLEYEQPAPAARWWQLTLAMIAMMAGKSTPRTILAFFWSQRPSAQSLADRSRHFCSNRAIPGLWSFPSSAVSTF